MCKLLWILVGLLTMPSFVAAQDQPAPADTTAQLLQLSGAACALFPAAARLPDEVDYYVTRTGRFSPTPQQVAEAEQALPTAPLQQIYERMPSRYYADYPLIIKQNLAKYQRQYYGFYNEKHQPCLHINFFYEPNVERSIIPVPYWLRAPIKMHDGGPAYWRIYYNLTTRQCYHFSHNGEG